MFKFFRNIYVTIRNVYRTGKRIEQIRAMAIANGTEQEFEEMLTTWLNSFENHHVRTYLHSLYAAKPTTTAR